MLVVLDEHRVVREVASGLLGVVGDFLAGFLASQWITRANEREQTVVIGLLIVFDERVVVALGALHIAAKKDPADIARDQIGLGATIEKETSGRPQTGISAACAQELGHHLIEGAV